MHRGDRADQAFTGLEAAIVLIAFIVVASVFSYTVLGTGISTSQKNQEVMHAALDEAGTTLRPGYTVIAKLDNNEGDLDFITFDLETATDLSAIDMGSMTYTVTTQDMHITFPPGDPRITLKWRHQKDTNDILDAGETVCVRLDTWDRGIRRGDTFTIDMTAAGGATASLTRTIPAGAEKNAYIELF